MWHNRKSLGKTLTEQTGFQEILILVERWKDQWPLKDTTGLWSWIPFSVSAGESRCLHYFHPHCNHLCRFVTAFGATDHLLFTFFVFQICVWVLFCQIYGSACLWIISRARGALWVDLSRLSFYLLISVTFCPFERCNRSPGPGWDGCHQAKISGSLKTGEM